MKEARSIKSSSAWSFNICSLAFISTDGMYRAMGHAGRDSSSPQFCDACFTGDYPIELTDQIGGEDVAQLSLLDEAM